MVYSRKVESGRRLRRPALLIVLAAFFASAAVGQRAIPRSQEISEADGLPVLIKHLPDWERVKETAVFAVDENGLRQGLGEDPLPGLIDFRGGTEAAAATYPEGRLLIIEYATPQASAEADARFQQFLAGSETNSSTVYRRVGNYNVFVFKVTDQAAAAALVDQVKYEKSVQWLGEDPFLLKRMERAFIYTTRDIFISTVLVIVLGIGGSVLAGIGVGYIFFRIREQQRSKRTKFSDAGGLTRLNLDDLSEPASTK